MRVPWNEALDSTQDELESDLNPPMEQHAKKAHLLMKWAYFLSLSSWRLSKCDLTSSLTTVGGESAR